MIGCPFTKTTDTPQDRTRFFNMDRFNLVETAGVQQPPLLSKDQSGVNLRKTSTRIKAEALFTKMFIRQAGRASQRRIRPHSQGTRPRRIVVIPTEPPLLIDPSTGTHVILAPLSLVYCHSEEGCIRAVNNVTPRSVKST